MSLTLPQDPDERHAWLCTITWIKATLTPSKVSVFIEEEILSSNTNGKEMKGWISRAWGKDGGVEGEEKRESEQEGKERGGGRRREGGKR